VLRKLRELVYKVLGLVFRELAQYSFYPGWFVLGSRWRRWRRLSWWRRIRR
jgi:hypothetical protein